MTTSGRSITQPGGLDGYAEWDAAYVLGALSPLARLKFEHHLLGCPGCRAAVSEIAQLPSLLSQAAQGVGPVRLLLRGAPIRHGHGIPRAASSNELSRDAETASVSR